VLFAQGQPQTVIFLPMSPRYLELEVYAPSYPAYLLRCGITNFLPELALNRDPLISTARVSGIKDVYHDA
jgi:hypothetical protein